MTDTAIREPASGQQAESHAGTAGPAPGPRRAWLVVASVVSALLVAWGTLSIVALLAHGERTVSDVFEGIRAVSIDNDNGWVTIRTVADPGMENGGTSDTVTVDQTISEGLRAPKVTDEIIDGVLYLRSSCPILVSIWCGVAYDVQIPEGIDVTLRGDNGRVQLSGSMGVVDVVSDNASIRATGLDAVSLRMKTDNGSISADGALASVVEAGTSNGSVQLLFDQPPTSVEARTSNGRVEVVVPPTGEAYRVDAATSNGRETVSVPTDPGSDRIIVARTSNGSVTVRT